MASLDYELSSASWFLENISEEVSLFWNCFWLPDGISLAGPPEFSIHKGLMNNWLNSGNRADLMLKICNMLKYWIHPSCFLTYIWGFNFIIKKQNKKLCKASTEFSYTLTIHWGPTLQVFSDALLPLRLRYEMNIHHYRWCIPHLCNQWPDYHPCRGSLVSGAVLGAGNKTINVVRGSTVWGRRKGRWASKETVIKWCDACCYSGM